MADPLRLDTPGAISGADISSAPSADGAIFYSYQQKGPPNAPPVQVVFKRLSNGTAQQVPLPMQVTGRGQLSVENGALYLTAWQESGIKTGWRIPVPGYVPTLPPAGGGTLPPRYVAALNRLCQFLGI